MPRKTRPSRPPSELFAEQMRIVRERKGLNQQQIADRLEEFGVAMDQRTISKIEQGKRGISLDDAVAIAAALGSTPADLCVPSFTGIDEDVAIGPNLVWDRRRARSWLAG